MDNIWFHIWLFYVYLTVVAGHPPRVDLAFAVDKSSSIGNTNLALAFDLIHNLLDHFSISSSTTRVSLLTYSSQVNTEFNFTSHLNRECLYATLKKLKIRSIKGKAATNLALKSIGKLYKKLSFHFSKKILILLTNGHSDKLLSIRKPVKQLKLQKIQIFVIGIGHKLNKNILKEIANFPLIRHLFFLKRKSQIGALISRLPGRRVPYTQCSRKGKGKIYDECRRECQCVNNTFTNCYRIRKEFTTFTSKEKSRYLRNYKILTTKEPFKSKYLKFIHKHYFYFWKGIHTTKQFLPWHRWYIWAFENLLREIDCRITVPFWDWSFWSNVAWDEGKHVWKNSFAGLGGNGDPKKDFCVEKGLFRERTWFPPLYENSKEIVKETLTDGGKVPVTYIKHKKHPFCLRREFNGVPYNLKRVQRALKLKASEFKDFELEVRGHYHDTLHCQIGGTMCTGYAADSPEFFFHHGILDNIWYRWQQKSYDRKFVHFKGKTFTMLTCIYTPEHFIDSDQLPMCTRVRYKDFTTGRTPPKISGNMIKYNDTTYKTKDDVDKGKEDNDGDQICLEDKDEEEEDEAATRDTDADFASERNNFEETEENTKQSNERNKFDEINRKAIDKARKLFRLEKGELARLSYLDRRLGVD